MFHLPKASPAYTNPRAVDVRRYTGRPQYRAYVRAARRAAVLAWCARAGLLRD